MCSWLKPLLRTSLRRANHKAVEYPSRDLFTISTAPIHAGAEKNIIRNHSTPLLPTWNAKGCCSITRRLVDEMAEDAIEHQNDHDGPHLGEASSASCFC